MPASKKNRLNNLHRILQAERIRLRDGLHTELVEKLGEGHSSHFNDALDAGDLSFVDLVESLGVKLVDIRQKQLSLLMEAERKLDDDTYGLCEICGAEISEQRLAALPFAIHCVGCAERLEGGEVRGKGPTL